MTETDIFIAGWRACAQRHLLVIHEMSSDWVPNGPPKATADAIIKRLSAIPTPVAGISDGRDLRHPEDSGRDVGGSMESGSGSSETPDQQQ
jgi:hypothetical protein